MKRRTLLAASLASFAAPAFAAPAAGKEWRDYEVIAWQSRDEAAYAAMRRAGITAGVVIADRNDAAPAPLGSRIAPLREAGLRWLVENIATDFYASYHRFTQGRAVNWRFAEARKLYRANPADPAALIREPSLSDPDWLARVRVRLGRVVRAHAPYRPLYYALADEAGIADLSANWDFDFSPASLAGFREWLHGVYPSLDALNAEWESSFTAWQDIAPMTTADALRAKGSVAGWMDFKAWMDEAFARAIRAGTDAVHAADPRALAGIEGSQIPGWGGYDYTRLPQAVDVMEIYEAAANVDLVRGLAPDLVLLTSVGSDAGGARSAHAVWRAVLQGTRGVILWDDKRSLPDGTEWHAVLDACRELRAGIGARLIAATPHREPVAVLYSPASFRVQWLLDRRAEGGDWTRRGARVEFTEEGPVREAFHRAVSTLLHRGVTPRFLTPHTLAAGGLDGVRVLVLPQAVALSDAEAAAIAAFIARGGAVVADGTQGEFDSHGKRRSHRVLAADRDPLGRLAELAPASLRVEGAAVEARVYDEPDGGRLVALHRDAGASGLAEATLLLPAPASISDARTGAALGRTERVRLPLEPDAPTIVAVAD
ncbi:MAG: beta-galactosidase [Alphaproteobacteria bacterium]|nr:beta-galactosidase [Alphaproteobacteria bacterium]